MIQGRSPARRWLTTEVVGLARGWWLLIGFVVAPLLLWLAKSAYDASAVESELPPRTVGSLEAPDTTAEDRAYEAIREIVDEKAQTEVEVVEKAPETTAPHQQPKPSAAIPPTTLALNCKRLKEAYSASELETMTEYQEHCR